MAKFTGIPGLKAQKKRPAKSAIASNHLTVVVGAGTFGARAVKRLRAREPRLHDCTIGIDGEISAAEAAESHHMIAPPDRGLGDYRIRARHQPVIAEDPLLESLDYPSEAERGAGASRPLGTIKAAVVLGVLRQKLGRIVRKRLAGLETQDRLMVDVHIATAACGGFGSALVIPLAIIARDEVRKIAPGAKCTIIVHLALSSLYEPAIADPRIGQKVVANDFATLLELNYAQPRPAPGRPPRLRAHAVADVRPDPSLSCERRERPDGLGRRCPGRSRHPEYRRR